ncbi:MAG: DUF4143 domain-containing protein [Actinobacteria bacterium]|nr:DUF4143 domain-containing protein [Actinomycetota bacterium]
MNPREYRPRVADAELDRALQSSGAVLIEGARACGKTATAMHRAESSVRLDLDQNAQRLAAVAPAMLLEGAKPRLIDEWQLAPSLWNHVRHAVDDMGSPGQFILTGSSVPADDETRHAGAGRFMRLRMRPMSLHEAGFSSGVVSLSALLSDGFEASGAGALSIAELIDRTVIGGWPALQQLDPEAAQDQLISYLDDVSRVDLARLDGSPRRDPARIRRLFRALGRSIATEASHATIAADLSDSGDTVRGDQVSGYLRELERVFVAEPQPSWSAHLRSRDTVRKAAKRHFVDPSLAAAALGAGAKRLIGDLEYFGQLFESLVVRDLRVYSSALRGSVSHYRDSAGTEVDAIVELYDGAWAAFEVKLADSKAEEAAEALLRFRAKLDPKKTVPPAALVVITAGQYAYTLPNGVHVVPLSALAP